MIELIALIISLIGNILKEYFKYKEIADAENKQYKIDRQKFAALAQSVITKMKKELQDDAQMPVDDLLDGMKKKS